MTNAIYFYCNNPAINYDHFILDQEITIKYYPYYLADVQRLNVELVGGYPYWF